MAMVGHAFWSHDMGGFHRQPTPDLYVRWTQMGLFSPLSRWHGMTTRLPWEYGAEAERIVRDATRLRYRLLPYIYTYAAIAAEEGLPLSRPMILEEPNDALVYGMDLQYHFGREILVAPIYNAEGRRPVYLPAGQWIDFHTHEVISGPVVRRLHAPLDIIPLYVRSNTLIPTMEPVEHIPDGPFPFVTFDAYLLPGGTGRFTLADEDGATEVTATLAGSQLNVQFSGAKQNVGLRVFRLGDAPQITSVTVNARPLPQAAQVDLHIGSSAGWMTADGALVAVIAA
jgi:alpha-D-xyloside xylohydrolase